MWKVSIKKRFNSLFFCFVRCNDDLRLERARLTGNTTPTAINGSSYLIAFSKGRIFKNHFHWLITSLCLYQRAVMCIVSTVGFFLVFNTLLPPPRQHTNTLLERRYDNFWSQGRARDRVKFDEWAGDNTLHYCKKNRVHSMNHHPFDRFPKVVVTTQHTQHDENGNRMKQRARRAEEANRKLFV